MAALLRVILMVMDTSTSAARCPEQGRAMRKVWGAVGMPPDLLTFKEAAEMAAGFDKSTLIVYGSCEQINNETKLMYYQ